MSILERTASTGMALESGEFAFELHETLGVGATGKVKRGVHKVSGETAAVKVVEKERFAQKPDLRDKVLRECDIVKDLKHPNIVEYKGYFEGSHELYIILELVSGGELFEHLLKVGKLAEPRARDVFTQLISAVHYFHSKNVCHRDIKPENILMDEVGNIKVADFGYARKGHAISDGSHGWVETSCGSPHYASPEVIVGNRYVGRQADVWSSGVVLFALLTGGLPFDDENIQKLLMKVKRGTFSIPKWVPAEAQNLIQSMLTVEPSNRITTDAIQQHPWFLDGRAPPMPSNIAVTMEEVPSGASAGNLSAQVTGQVGRFQVAMPSDAHGGAAPADTPATEGPDSSGDLIDMGDAIPASSPHDGVSAVILDSVPMVVSDPDLMGVVAQPHGAAPEAEPEPQPEPEPASMMEKLTKIFG